MNFREQNRITCNKTSNLLETVNIGSKYIPNFADPIIKSHTSITFRKIFSWETFLKVWQRAIHCTQENSSLFDVSGRALFENLLSYRYSIQQHCLSNLTIKFIYQRTLFLGQAIAGNWQNFYSFFRRLTRFFWVWSNLVFYYWIYNRKETELNLKMISRGWAD